MLFSFSCFIAESTTIVPNIQQGGWMRILWHENILMLKSNLFTNKSYLIVTKTKYKWLSIKYRCISFTGFRWLSCWFSLVLSNLNTIYWFLALNGKLDCYMSWTRSRKCLVQMGIKERKVSYDLNFIYNANWGVFERKW